jgi:hypothetical protein
MDLFLLVPILTIVFLMAQLVRPMIRRWNAREEMKLTQDMERQTGLLPEPDHYVMSKTSFKKLSDDTEYASRTVESMNYRLGKAESNLQMALTRILELEKARYPATTKALEDTPLKRAITDMSERMSLPEGSLLGLPLHAPPLMPLTSHEQLRYQNSQLAAEVSEARKVVREMKARQHELERVRRAATEQARHVGEKLAEYHIRNALANAGLKTKEDIREAWLIEQDRQQMLVRGE